MNSHNYNKKNAYTYIIVLNYNAYKDTIECLESIEKIDSKFYKILVVDNASTDSSVIKIKKWISSNSYNNIDIIKSDFNGGYASGNNLGIKYALKRQDCIYIWILNNDTIIYPDTLKKLINADQNKSGETIWGSKILYKNGNIQSLGCRINKKFMISSHNYNGSNNQEEEFKLKRIDYIHGCSIFFKKNIVNKVGMFSEEYFMFFEDVDFCKKALKKNISLEIVQNSILIHKEGLSIKNNNLEYLSIINRIIYAKKFYPENIFYVYIGIFYKVLKSILLLRWNLTKKIIVNLIK